MITKKALDQLLMLTRKWHNESDSEKAAEYLQQAKALSVDIAEGTPYTYTDQVAGNVFFSTAWYIADTRKTNRQMYIMLYRKGIDIPDYTISD